jgi:hypothetical protein
LWCKQLKIFQIQVVTVGSLPFIIVNGKHGLIRGVASLARDSLVIFYYFSEFEIWPDKEAWPYKMGITVITKWSQYKDI